MIRPSNIVIGFVFFVLIIGLGLTIMTQANSVSNDFMGDFELTALNKTFNKIDALSANKTALESKLFSGQGGSPSDWYNFLFGLSWGAITLLPTMIAGLAEVITAAGSIFGFIIPSYVSILLVLALLFITIFGILSVILNREV